MSTLSRIFRSIRRTLFQAVPTMFVIVTLGFVLLQLAPGDAADFLAAQSGAATEETMAAVRSAYGVDQPVIQQLLKYYASLAHLSLGESPRFGVPVADIILQRLPNTLLLMAVSITLSLSVGLLLGSIMAYFDGRMHDQLIALATLLLYSIPNFWIGLMLIIVFAAKLGWLPSGGVETIGSSGGFLEELLDRARHLVLPALSLSLYYIAIYARITRASVLEVLSQDYVRTAAAKGISHAAVMRRHVLRNALTSVTTLAGVHVAGIIGGALVVETVFSWPGLGRLAYESVMAREYPVLLGIFLTSSLTVIAINAVIDLVNSLIDPRIEIR